jgi:hypothetical protein
MPCCIRWTYCVGPPPAAGVTIQSTSHVTFAVLLPVLLYPALGHAESFWSWHGFDYVPVKTSKLEWTLHTRLRTRSGELQQGRSGSLLKYSFHRRVAGIAGYYYGKEEDSVDEFRDVHRVFGGFETPLLRRARTDVAFRSLYEYFFRETRPSSPRYRQRVRLTQNRRIGPSLQAEWFFDKEGYLSGRYNAGVRWKAAEWSTVEVGYLYDRRRASIGLNRHALVTSITFQR